MVLRYLLTRVLIILPNNVLRAQTFKQMKQGKWAVRSSIKSVETDFAHKVLIIVRDGAEVLDTIWHLIWSMLKSRSRYPKRII